LVPTPGSSTRPATKFPWDLQSLSEKTALTTAFCQVTTCFGLMIKSSIPTASIESFMEEKTLM
jgi:hypothetical protein